MPQKFLYDPVQLLFRQLSQLTAFQDLLQAADAAEALSLCRFLQTEWDAEEEIEIPLVPGCIGGIQDGLTRTRGNATQFKSSNVALWIMLQATVPNNFATTLTTAYPTEFADRDPQPWDWFALQCQTLWDALEADVIAAGANTLDITQIQVLSYPQQARLDKQVVDLEAGAFTGNRDYWWTAWQLTIRG